MKKLKEVLHFAAGCSHIEIRDEEEMILFTVPEEGNIDDMLIPNYEITSIHYNNDEDTCCITVHSTSKLTLGSIMDYLSGNIIVLNKYLDEIGAIWNNGEQIVRGDGKSGNLAEEPVYDIRAVGGKVYVTVRG